jgi:glycerophosphoryl diester phosphodiesterase
MARIHPKMIGHRGAAGVALENSRASLRAALDFDISGVEFDVRRTKDHKLIVMHDRHTGRVANKKHVVKSLTFDELQNLELKNGQSVPTLEEALEIIGDKKVIVIDIKDSGVTNDLMTLLERFPKAQVEFTSLLHNELALLRAARPDIPIFVLEHFSPFEIIHTARRMHAAGISLNMWLMNPLTYWLANRYKLELRVYTVNSPFIVKLMRLFYPNVVIYTDHPERFEGK